MFHPTKLHWFGIIIPIILSVTVVILIFYHANDLIITLIPSFLIVAIIGSIIKGFNISTKTREKFFLYYLSSFPLQAALLILMLLYGTGASTTQPLFTADMWFVVLASLGAIFGIYYTERRINRLESRLDSINDHKKTDDPPNIPHVHRNRLERASQIATIISAAALIFAGATLYYTYTQGAIIEKQFKIENMPPEIPSIIAGDVYIQNDTYVGYPFVEKLSISIISPHLLKVEIKKIEFVNPHSGNFKQKPEISTRPIEKYIDKGISNLDFDIPFQLTFDVKDTSPSPPNTTRVGFPLKTYVIIYDLQNNSSIVRNDTLYSYLAVKGEYLPKTND